MADQTLVTDTDTEPTGLANSGYKGSPDSYGFDRWNSDSPDVKTNDMNAFAQSLAESTAYEAALQQSCAAWMDGPASGDLGGAGILSPLVEP